MKRLSAYILILISIAAASAVPGLPQAREQHPAEASLLKLAVHTPQRFQPLSNKGFVLVTLVESAVLINGRSAKLHIGETRQIAGETTLTLENEDDSTEPFVLVSIRKANQDLSIVKEELEAHQSSEDASNRNDTLLIALTPLTLRDVHDLGESDGPWKSAPPTTVSLPPGRSFWLKPGMHRLKNLSQTKARFVTVEW